MDTAITPEPNDALIIVDMQNDFLPGGSLAVPEGNEVIPTINGLIDAFRAAGRPIFATRDWHPADHCSFTNRGGTWPSHCVMETAGAEISKDLRIDDAVELVSKASDSDVESYSGFHNTDLGDRLSSLGVERIIVVGLATDYCVLHTVLDGLDLGFEVVVVEDGIRAVDVEAGDGDRAIERMRGEGARLLASHEAA